MDHENRMRRDADFARWYTLHHDRIRSLCSRLLRDQAAGEDIAQETLLRAWTRRDSMRDEDIGAWLSVVARNLCISYMRRESRVMPLDPLQDRPDHSADPATEVERTETRRNVRRALRGVSRRHRRVLYLREVHGVDYRELGSELGMTPEGVRSIAFRARAVLRERLAAVGEGFSAVLLGLKIRIRAVRARVNAQVQMFEASLSSAMNVGLGIALVMGGASLGFQATPATVAVGGSDVLRGTASAAPGVSDQPETATGRSMAAATRGSVLNGAAKPKVGADFRTREDETRVDLTLLVPNPVTGPDSDFGSFVRWDDEGIVSSRVFPIYRDACTDTGACELVDRRL